MRASMRTHEEVSDEAYPLAALPPVRAPCGPGRGRRGDLQRAEANAEATHGFVGGLIGRERRDDLSPYDIARDQVALAETSAQRLA